MEHRSWSQLEKKFETILEKGRADYALPGIVASVQLGTGNESLCWAGAAGVKNAVTGQALTTDCIFHMASVTKLFVSTVLLQLWEEKKLDLEELLIEIIPELKTAAEGVCDVRLWHLMTHTARLAPLDDLDWDKPRVDEAALEEYILLDAAKKMEFLPGEKGSAFCYSDLNYEILGVVAQRKTGRSIEELVEERILSPLGMDRSTLLTFRRAQGESEAADSRLLKPEVLDRIPSPPMAMAHGRREDGSLVLEQYYPYSREHCPSSTLTANGEDIQRFAASHLAHITGNSSVPRLLRDETYQLAWRQYAQVPNNGEGIGLGWFIRRQGNYTFYGHEGTDTGFRASFWICPELGLSILVNSNVTKAPVKRILKDMAQAVLEWIELDKK